MLASSSEAVRPCFWLSERVTGFPGLRPGWANPRMLAWELGDSQLARTPGFSLESRDDAIGDSTNKATHLRASCVHCSGRAPHVLVNMLHRNRDEWKGVFERTSPRAPTYPRGHREQ